MRFISLIIIIGTSLVYSNDISYIDNISIIGNKNISKATLYKNMILKKPSLFMRTEFSNKIYQQDIQNIIGYYKSHGYLEVQVKSNIKKQKNKYIEIIYSITEGTQYLFNTLNISGNKIFNKNKISSFFKESLGNNYNPNLIMNQLIKLKREYLKNGKLEIIIKEEIIIKGNFINLRINISEGENFKIQDININGLKTINKKYITRELTFHNGDIFNIKNINNSRKRIFDSGLFSSVEIIPDIQENSPGYVDIIINIREYKLSSIEVDFGFSELSAWQNNLLTPGLDAHVKWTLGNVMSSASNIILSGGIASEINFQSIENKSNLQKLDSKFIYTSPWTFNMKFPTKLEIFYDIENDDDININRLGASYSAYWEKNYSSRYEILSTYEIINSDSLNIIEFNEPIRSVEFNYINNKVINIFRPTGGSYFQFKSILFGNILGGKRNFIKMTCEYRKYFPIFKRGIIACRFKLGYIENSDKSSSLPSYYLFELGGQTSLRGWPLPSTFSDPKNKFELLNIEYRFPIYRNWGGEIFYDIGSLLNTNNLMEYDINWNYGFGITYDTTIGPIRLEYAIPGNNNLDFNETIHASILYMF